MANTAFAANGQTKGLQAVQASWIQWAIKAYEKSKAAYERYEDYYVGDHKLEFATDRWRQAFGTTFKEFSDNWCQVVVDAAVERLEILGWESEDKTAAKVAEQIADDVEFWNTENDLHTQSLVKGDGYLIVWPDPEDEHNPCIYYNDALDINFVYEAENYQIPARASKRWKEDDGSLRMNIFFKDHIDKYVVPSTIGITEAQVAAMEFAGTPAGSDVLPQGWNVLSGSPLTNNYKVLPVFHFKNRSPGSTHGQSELKTVIPIQNGVNKLLMDMMLASEFSGFRQKWMAGGGHPREGWQAGAQRFWATTDPNAKFGEFGQTDLAPFVMAIDMMVAHIAKITHTPMHYLRTSGDMPSGEALKASEAGLVYKVFKLQQAWGARHSKWMSMAHLIKTGSEPKSPIKPKWKHPATRHDLEQAQTAQLKALLGIPLDQLWVEHFGYSEEQVKQFSKGNELVVSQILTQLMAQTGQLPPGLQDVGAMNIPQLIAALPKAATAGTAVGETQQSPQPNTRPPGSPTRRSSGFDRGVGNAQKD